MSCVKWQNKKIDNTNYNNNLEYSIRNLKNGEYGVSFYVVPATKDFVFLRKNKKLLFKY